MSWIRKNVADAFSQLLFIKNITYRCILESLFFFQLKQKKMFHGMGNTSFKAWHANILVVTGEL